MSDFANDNRLHKRARVISLSDDRALDLVVIFLRAALNASSRGGDGPLGLLRAEIELTLASAAFMQAMRDED